MNKKHVVLFLMLISSTAIISGCDNAETKRQQLCATAILDFQQKNLLGDNRIDIDTVKKTIAEHGCTYKDVTQKDRTKREDEIKNNPIPNNKSSQNGKDWSKPWNEK